VPSAAQFVTLLAATRARRREQWLSPAELKERRGTRLRRLARAAGKTAYYGRLFREAGARAGPPRRRQLTAEFGPGLRFHVVPVEDIPLAPTGKLQTIVPLDGSAASATS